MSDQIQRVVECSQRLTDLRRRWDELEKERNALKSEIDGCIDQLALLTAGRVVPPPDLSPSGSVIWLLRRDPSHAMSPADVAQALGLTEDMKS